MKSHWVSVHHVTGNITTAAGTQRFHPRRQTDRSKRETEPWQTLVRRVSLRYFQMSDEIKKQNHLTCYFYTHRHSNTSTRTLLTHRQVSVSVETVQPKIKVTRWKVRKTLEFICVWNDDVNFWREHTHPGLLENIRAVMRLNTRAGRSEVETETETINQKLPARNKNFTSFISHSRLWLRGPFRRFSQTHSPEAHNKRQFTQFKSFHVEPFISLGKADWAARSSERVTF